MATTLLDDLRLAASWHSRIAARGGRRRMLTAKTQTRVGAMFN
jgi:hypothetical protein